jgi:FkbM family methyltransferase
MLIEFKDIVQKYNLNIRGVIHIGAHHGEELFNYIEQNIQSIILFEPLEENFKHIKEKISKINSSSSIEIHQVALGNSTGIISMNLSSNDLESSSILKPKLHLIQHDHVKFEGTEQVKIDKLDNYNLKNFNFLNIDVQGYELEVLKGAENTLDFIDYIYCEVNRDEVYENNAKIEDIDFYLSFYNFKRVETNWWQGTDWGDALYIKEKK